MICVVYMIFFLFISSAVSYLAMLALSDRFSEDHVVLNALSYLGFGFLFIALLLLFSQ